MQTLLAFAITAGLSFGAGAYVQYRFNLKRLAYQLKEELRPSVVNLIDRAEALQDAAEDELEAKAATLSDLARRIKNSF